MPLVKIYQTPGPPPPTQVDYLSDILNLLREINEQLTAIRYAVEN